MAGTSDGTGTLIRMKNSKYHQYRCRLFIPAAPHLLECESQGVTALFFMCLNTPLSGYKSVDSVPRLVEEYMNKRLKVDEFVTHSLPFDKIADGFDLMHAGKW